MVTRIYIEIPAVELLGGIWYSDGSGAPRKGLGIDSTPNDWEIAAIDRQASNPSVVLITLTRKEDT